MKANALAVMGELRVWYPIYANSLSEEARRSVTRIQMIDTAQLGSMSDSGSNSFIDFKGQENRHFQPFVLHLRGAPYHSEGSLSSARTCSIAWLSAASASTATRAFIRAPSLSPRKNRIGRNGPTQLETPGARSSPWVSAC